MNARFVGKRHRLEDAIEHEGYREAEMTRQKGFTLIELLTTLGVATILLSVAIPGMQEFRKNSRQTGGINELVSGMRIARNTAITTNTRVTVCASENGSACQSVGWEKGWIAFVDQDADRTLDTDESVIRAGSGKDGLTIKSSQFSNNFVFRPNGRVMGASLSQNSGQFTICDDRGVEDAKAIVIDFSGRPRSIHDASGSGLTLSCS
jgi:type IV fimbrial biogenesis protein FimT